LDAIYGSVSLPPWKIKLHPEVYLPQVKNFCSKTMWWSHALVTDVFLMTEKTLPLFVSYALVTALGSNEFCK